MNDAEVLVFDESEDLPAAIPEAAASLYREVELLDGERARLQQLLLVNQEQRDRQGDRLKVMDALVSVNDKQSFMIHPISRKRNGTISPAVRSLVSANLANGMSRSVVERVFDISHGSVVNIARESLEEENGIPPAKKSKTGRKSPFDDSSSVVLLLDLLEEDSGYTVSELKGKMASLGVMTSKSAITR